MKEDNLKAKKKGFFIKLFNLLVWIFLICTLALIVLVVYSLKDIPSIEKIQNYKHNLTTRIYSKDGQLLNNYATEKRIFIAIDEIPSNIKEAFISAEDSNFYSHSGVDFLGILKAMYKNVIFFTTGKGQLVGASTITQQVVKNIFLTNEKTIARKVKEMLLALEISKHISKNEMLEIYLNYIYFGSGAYGIYAASEEYFGKTPKELSLEEASLLAALPKAPSEINPKRNPVRALERRNWVLSQMLNNKYIAEEQFEIAKELPIMLSSKSSIKRSGYDGVNAFADYVKSEISKDIGSDNFFSSGLFVQTTMDYEVQKSFFKAVRDGLLSYDKRMGFRGVQGVIAVDDNTCQNFKEFLETVEIRDAVLRYGVITNTAEEGLEVLDETCNPQFIRASTMRWAQKTPLDFKDGQIIIYEDGERPRFSQLPAVNAGLIVMDAKDGSVLGMVGDFYDRPNAFNRAMQAKRQLGSAIKPFVYLTALENGFAPNSILVDEEFTLADEWQPRNHSRDFLGSVTLRVALERSRNVPTVRVAEILGINKITNNFEKLGLNADPIEKNLTTVLGSFNVTVQKVAEALSIFPNGGKKVKTNFIQKIQDANGKNIFARDNICNESCFDESKPPIDIKPEENPRIIEEDVAFQVLSMLEGAVQRGTGRGVLSVAPLGLGGKTGTSSNFKDAWFVAVSNKLIIVLYVGNDNATSLGENQYGAVVSLPIVKAGLQRIVEKYPLSEFQAPASLEKIVIDYDTGGLPTPNTTTQIIEYFKESDSRPQKRETLQNEIY
jgi:penicillin-binding protein 1A